MPTVSVIVPVHNVESYLPRCIDSILAQTYTDFELILVDDGSPDRSGAICDEYAAKDSRIRVIHKENGGVSSARNAGLAAAKGDFIGWVDADDIVEKDMYEVMIRVAKLNNADIVQCQHNRENILNNSPRSEIFTEMTGTDFVKRIFLMSGANYTNQVSLWSKIYRKDLFQDIVFPLGRTYEDEQETYKVCLKANKLIEIPDILYHYVYREHSIITGVSSIKMLHKQTALLNRLEVLPTKLPELEGPCAVSFLHYSKNILCHMHQHGNSENLHTAMHNLLSKKDALWQYLSIYDKIYLSLLKLSLFRTIILRYDFEPIQKLIRTIFWWKYRK